MNDRPAVTVTPGGPYLVPAGVPLRRRRIVTSAEGESVTWETTAEVPTDGDYELCRCGGSSNKPFCDGTHETREWDATETATADTYDERAKTYPGTGVVVRDDRSICAHAGFCSTRATNVWKSVADTSDTAVRSTVMAMVERCPSGALTYRLVPEGPDVEPQLPDAVLVVEDGPLEVTGRLGVVRADGAPMETRNRMVLCRCGQSGNKPLCDGSHAAAGFHDSEPCAARR